MRRKDDPRYNCSVATALASALNLFRVDEAGGGSGTVGGLGGVQTRWQTAGREGSSALSGRKARLLGSGSSGGGAPGNPVVRRTGGQAVLPLTSLVNGTAPIITSDPALATAGNGSWVAGQGYVPLAYGCPLFARKFPQESVPEALAMGLSCNGLGLGSWCLRASSSSSSNGAAGTQQ